MRPRQSTTTEGIPYKAMFDMPQGTRIELRPHRLKKHMAGIDRSISEIRTLYKGMKIVLILPSKMNK